MNYSEMSALYKNKFKDATYTECENAIRDIDETLVIHKDKDVKDPYVVKLLCERDAVLDRKMMINRKSK